MIFVAIAAIAAIGQTLGAYFFARVLRERDARHAVQIDQLLNRIQAPQLAVATSLSEDAPAPERQYVNWDDDNDFHEALQEAHG